MKKRWIAAAAALCAVLVAGVVLTQRETPAPVIQKNTESSSPSSASSAGSSVPSVSGADVFAFQDYMDQKAGEIRRAKNLAYDEGVIFEEQGLFWEVDGIHELVGLAAIQKQYPQAAPKAEYHGYRFSSLTVNPQREWHQVESPKHATGEVFRRDVSLRSASTIMARYTKGEDWLDVTILKGLYPMKDGAPENILDGDRSGYELQKGLTKGSVYSSFRYRPEQGEYTIDIDIGKSAGNIAEALIPQPNDSGTADERTTRQGILTLLDTLNVKGEYKSILQQYGLQ